MGMQRPHPHAMSRRHRAVSTSFFPAPNARLLTWLASVPEGIPFDLATPKVDSPLPCPAPTPPPPPIPAAPLLRDLLHRLRQAHQAAPSASASSLISQLQPPPPSEPPPAPPPLIPLVPDPKRPNPHIVGAFWLQALFLGASALGLLGRRKKGGVIEDRAEREDAIEMRAQADALSINLLLSSYIPFPEEDDSRTRQKPWRPIKKQQAETSLSAVQSAITQFAASKSSPDHWTVLSVMSFVTALPSKPSSPPTKTEQARPILALWAWKVFSSLPPTSSHADLVTLSAFVDYLAHPPPFATGLSKELLSSVSDHILTSPPSPPQIPTPHTTPRLLHSLGQTALSLQDISTIVVLTSPESPLRPVDKIELSVKALEMIGLDEELRNAREVVRDVGEGFAGAVRAAYGCEPREWTRKLRPVKIAMDTEGLEPVPLKLIDGAPVGRGSELDIDRVRRGVDLLRASFRVDVPLEDIYSDVTTVLLTFAPTTLTDTWLLTILNSLVTARHPRLAVSLFHLIPASTLTLAHFNSLLRTHHSPTSSHIFSLLLANPNFSPSRETFHSRLVSHAHPHNLALSSAHADLRLMTHCGFTRDTKAWNLLLKILVRTGSERALHRNLLRMAAQDDDGDVAPNGDAITHGVLLLRSTLARRIRSDGPGRRLVADGAGRSGLRQVRNVLRRMSRLDVGDTGIGANILLRPLGRWSVEVRTDDLVQLVWKALGVDLRAADGEEPFGGRGEAPTREEWESERRPAYDTFLKAFRNRGEKRMRGRLLWAKAVEERLMRERERREAVEQQGEGKDLSEEEEQM